VLAIGLYGYNFEVSSPFTLANKDEELYIYVDMGSEGGNVSFHEFVHWAVQNEVHVICQTLYIWKKKLLYLICKEVHVGKGT
jgi:hypothetical protein